MPNGSPDSSNLLWTEGQETVIDFKRTSPTDGTLSWTVPKNPRAYDGMLIVASLREINSSNLPTDSVRYTASADMESPADRIGNAQVVVAIYGDQVTSTASVTGLEPDAAYFFSAHVVSSVYTYYTPGVRSYPQSMKSSAYAGEIDHRSGPPEDPIVGRTYFDQTQQLTFVWDGDAWVPTKSHTTLSGEVDPTDPFDNLPEGYPSLGDFFYNSRQKRLKLWNGTEWVSDVESESGVPSYQKQDVGTNLEYSARSNLIDILKKQLGWPVVCVELTEDHFNIAIDNALQTLRQRTDVAYTKQYFFMSVHPHQDIYYLNDPTTGTNKIVDVVKIHRLNNLGLSNFTPDNIFAQQFLNQFYAPGIGYDLVSIHLIHSMGELFRILFAGEIAFNWREARRQLQIYKRLSKGEKVLLETSCEKLEQELLTDRWTQQWLQQWAESECMFTLSQIRGKFGNLPGPGGSMTLNAAELMSEGIRLQEDCIRQIKDMEVGQNGPDNWYSPFVMG